MQDLPNVTFKTSDDGDASRICAVLEAIGFHAVRDLEDGDDLEWPIARVTRRHRLTDRETQILRLVIVGHGNEQISHDLEISRATVKWHMHNIFVKTNTGNREALLRLVMQIGRSK